MTITSLTNFDQRGEIKLNAEEMNAPTLKNDTNKELRISFTVTGSWCLYKSPTSDPALTVFTAQTDSRGYQLPKDIYDRNEWRIAGAPAGALVVFCGGGGREKTQLTSPDSVDLPPECYALFICNTLRSHIRQSQGQLTIKYACSLKDSPAAAPSPQPAAPVPAKEPSANPVSVNPIKEPAATRTGKLLVLHDEYILSDHGFQQAPDTAIFIKNIAQYLTGGKGGRFLDYSSYYISNPTVLGTELEKALSTPPYAFKRDRSVPLDPNTLSTYDVVFVGGEQVDNQMLVDYIRSGGNVCLIAGTGHGGSESEAAQWRQLLSAFGLRLETSYNLITGVLPVTSPAHPLFAGVKALYQYWGQSIQLQPDSKASIVMTSDSNGLIGLAEAAVASPSVAQTPKLAWGGWDNLGGGILGGQAPMSWGKDHLEVYVRGTDKACWRIQWTSKGWSGFESLGGAIPTDLAAVTWGPGHREVFGLGMDYGLWRMPPQGNVWINMGGKFSTDAVPVPISWGKDHLEVFVRGQDGSLMRRAWKGNNTFSEWENLGGPISSDPAVVSWGPGHLEIFALGANNAIMRKVWTGNGFSAGWENLGGQYSGRPAAISWGSGHLELFVRGSNEALYNKAWNGNGWTDWQSLGGQLVGNPAVESWGPGHLEVFVRGKDSALYHKCKTGTGWPKDWENLQGTITHDPVPVSWGPGHLEVLARGSNGSLWHRWWKP
ncbi:MAG: hypothetical protein ACK5N0_01540 [Synechococcaceae cyanobacterium]